MLWLFHHVLKTALYQLKAFELVPANTAVGAALSIVDECTDLVVLFGFFCDGRWGFFAASDTFGGNSGSGVYTPVVRSDGEVEFQLLGLMVNTPPPSVPTSTHHDHSEHAQMWSR